VNRVRFLLTLLLPWIFATGFADDSAEFQTALTDGKFGINVRARYERVEQDGLVDEADAITARLRLNYRTGGWGKLSAFVEHDTVFHLLSDFNSGAGTSSPARSQFPVIADPKGSDLNQLYLDYNLNKASRLRIGRQRILIDNQRFVGGVGWRQNEQTYDAISYSTSALAKTKFFYSYVGFVRRIFGDGVAAGKNNVDAHLLNARITINDRWSITPYYYRIDNQDVATFSTATAGARLSGSATLGDSKLKLLADFATQSDIASNPTGYDAQYAYLGGTLTMPNDLSVGIAYESLGGSSMPGRMFRTPLATLHAFQGWADKFLATPSAGIDDVFLTVKYKIGKWNLSGVYHDFSAENGSTDYGTEFDFSATRRYSENYSILLKGAFFSGESAALTDTNKLWIVFTANY
jgi:hypothetical protein